MRLMRLKVSSVSFDFLIVSSILLAFSSAKAVKIGVMVNPYLPTRREQEVAIRIAAQHFNSSSPLVLRFNETSDDPVETSTTAKDMVGWGAEVIIGIGTWPEVVTLARVGNASGVPILSLAEKTTGSNLLSTMPFLVQMSYPTYSDEVLCLANIISSYNWRRVIVIYEDDIYSSISSIATLFSDALQANGSKIDHHIVFPSMHTAVPNVAELVREKLQNIPPQLSKVFVVLRSSPQLANYLFMEAKEHNLMAADHVWIVSDDITDLLDSNFSQSFISSYMQGVIGIRTYFNQTTTFYQNFSIDFQKNLSNNNIEPRRLAVRAYDAIHVIANAVAARDRNKNITLWKGILTNNFLGLSGFINFSTIGTNLPQVRGFSVFRVLNVVGKSYKEIGYWSKGYGFYEDEEEMSQFGSSVVPMLRPILWPGHMGKIPKIPGGWGKLKIGVPNHTTFEKFVKVEYDDDSGMVKEPQGFCIEVFKEILKNLNYDLLYEWAPFHGSYDDLVNQVSLKKFDVAVGDITILAGRAVNVTFTVPFLSSGLSILVPIRPNHTPWMLTKPFTKEVWFLILATLIYTCVVLWYLEHKNNPQFHGNWRQQLGAALWLTFSTLFNAHGKVYSFYTKTVVIAWLLVVLILTTSFTANLSSILTVEKIEPVPAGSRVGCDGDSFVLKYLQNVLNFKAQNIMAIGKPEAYVDAFKSGNISAAYLETPYLRVFLSRYDKYTVIGETYMLGGFGFVFPKDSPLADDFSEVILKLREDGTFKKLEQDEFSFTLSNTPSPDKERRRDSLSIESFWALFVFTGSISTIMLILFTRHLILQNGRRLSNVLFGSMRRSFKTVWTMTKKRREKEEKVFPVSSQEGTIHGQNDITIIDINLPRNHADDDNI